MLLSTLTDSLIYQDLTNTYTHAIRGIVSSDIGNDIVLTHPTAPDITGYMVKRRSTEVLIGLQFLMEGIVVEELRKGTPDLNYLVNADEASAVVILHHNGQVTVIEDVNVYSHTDLGVTPEIGLTKFFELHVLVKVDEPLPTPTPTYALKLEGLQAGQADGLMMIMGTFTPEGEVTSTTTLTITTPSEQVIIDSMEVTATDEELLTNKVPFQKVFALSEGPGIYFVEFEVSNAVGTIEPWTRRAVEPDWNQIALQRWIGDLSVAITDREINIAGKVRPERQEMLRITWAIYTPNNTFLSGGMFDNTASAEDILVNESDITLRMPIHHGPGDYRVVASVGNDTDTKEVTVQLAGLALNTPQTDLVGEILTITIEYRPLGRMENTLNYLIDPPGLSNSTTHQVNLVASSEELTNNLAYHTLTIDLQQNIGLWEFSSGLNGWIPQMYTFEHT